MRAPEFWTRNDSLSRIAGTLLSPLGWVYGAATYSKRSLAHPHRARAKVLCVGNLTAGGSGKTPVVRKLVSMFQERRLRTIVLTRGYGGRMAGPLLVQDGSYSAHDVGDEALMLSAVAPVVVARDRAMGAIFADAEGADVIVMDDGYQNFELAKDLSLLVIDAEFGFGNGRLLPAGPLREFVPSGLSRADAVVILGNGAVPLFGYSGPVVRGRLSAVPAEPLAGRRVVAFAGIGRPEKFFESLRGLGAELVEAVAFADHHPYRPTEIESLKRKAANAGAALITTEKDHVRLSPDARDGVETLPIAVEFDDPAACEGILDRIAPLEHVPAAELRKIRGAVPI